MEIHGGINHGEKFGEIVIGENMAKLVESKWQTTTKTLLNHHV
jgi:hypothetical protein